MAKKTTSPTPTSTSSSTASKTTTSTASTTAAKKKSGKIVRKVKNLGSQLSWVLILLVLNLVYTKCNGPKKVTRSKSTILYVDNISYKMKLSSDTTYILKLTNKFTPLPNLSIEFGYKFHELSENGIELEFKNARTGEKFSGWYSETDRPLFNHNAESYYVRCKTSPVGALIITDVESCDSCN